MTTNLPPLDTLLGPSPPPNLSQMRYQRWAYLNPPKDPQFPFTHKTVLVTGANTGLGFEAALKFAHLGCAQLILAVRTPAKGREAKNRIVQATNYPEARITILQLDQNSFASVRAFPQTLSSTLGSSTLDVAVLNAGIAAPRYAVNKTTGWESALQVNIISTAMLAIALMPLLKRRIAEKGEPAQLTFTGSVGHKYVKPEQMPPLDSGNLLRVINSAEFFNVEKNYCVIKLLNMYVMKGLIDDYVRSGPDGKTPVFVNVVCPGFCVTDLGREFPWHIVAITKAIHWYCGRTAEQGGRSLVSATLLGGEGHGRFWVNDGFPEPAELLTSPEGKRFQLKLWGEIREVCEKELAA
ncbi:NAD(P)-binding protein [Aspergillus heteromorphus CBS 117.55]|uniref:NAD(P)-binding protein n=1 Tax=Aspergillus heteromorphus CBS 117.55 TaxID=1448321 RepID=A0A317VX80_9EURO|nr:NAD(P)-binding protein [Aspergillus heteromorphus CBS 117.55]PWY78209.1 NAD(P)-binding protein [Aspergillus heteromorphus CBS 117.55]